MIQHAKRAPQLKPCPACQRTVFEIRTAGRETWHIECAAMDCQRTGVRTTPHAVRAVALRRWTEFVNRWASQHNTDRASAPAIPLRTTA